METIGLLTRLRFMQIRGTAKVCAKLACLPLIGGLLRVAGRSQLASHALVGFSTVFTGFEDASRYASRYKVPSHEHPGNTATHLELNITPRPSDYPVLFHMYCHSQEIHSVADIGGSAGNLFYCFDRYLHFDPCFSWTVNDVPANNRFGEQLAEQRHEHRLHFVDRLIDCGPVDLALISGSLHYFQDLPSEIVSRAFYPLPRFVIINRTPVIDGDTVVTIQDARHYYAMAPARILSRTILIQCMEALGYVKLDEWTVPDLQLRIPLHPECSASYYSGFYFQLQVPEPKLRSAA